MKYSVVPLPGSLSTPYSSAMARDDALDDGEADAGALELPVPVQPLEHVEQLVHIPHVEAHAVVLSPIGIFRFAGGEFRLNHLFGTQARGVTALDKTLTSTWRSMAQ